LAEAERYRIEVTRSGRWWCEVILEGPGALVAAADLVARLPADEGFSCTLNKEREVSRLVEVGERTRVLSRSFERVMGG